MGFLGIDIGGTFIKYVFEDKIGLKTEKIYIKELVEKNDREGIIKEIENIVSELSPKGLGIAVAGLIDKKEGIITNSPNIKPFEHFPIKQSLEKRLNIPVLVENDANLAAYGEYLYGAGKNGNILICLTLGTGLGGGAVINGNLLTGVSGSAMEVGHMTIDKNGWICHCGRKGCLEAYVSSYGLERIYFFKTGRYLPSSEIILLANEGKEEAMESLEELSKYLSYGLMNLLHLFNPDKILLAGGIPEHYPLIAELATSDLKKLAFPLPFRDVSIDIASLGEFSGAYGALGYIKKYMEEK
ncbi:MAG: ROK family protein [Aquificota bacterium]|nr:MAG: ROK family protein [Aquificota bacterium]